MPGGEIGCYLQTFPPGEAPLGKQWVEQGVIDWLAVRKPQKSRLRGRHRLNVTRCVWLIKCLTGAKNDRKINMNQKSGLGQMNPGNLGVCARACGHTYMCLCVLALTLVSILWLWYFTLCSFLHAHTLLTVGGDWNGNRDYTKPTASD